MRTVIEPTAPATLAEANLQPRGSVHPSPLDWRDQVLYFLLPDRFSDGGEDNRPLFSAAQPDQFRTPDKRAWMQAGKTFQGGTLRGITSKLDYLRDLGVTCLWIGPVWKQRADLETYHGYGIQNFLDVDPLTTLGIPCIYYGTEQALDGSESRHDFSVEPELSFEDRYIREAMFGAVFGAFETSGCHFFAPDHPTYLRIAAIARLRQSRSMVGLTLRRGRQYLREISRGEEPFALPRAGDLVAWSRILFSQEVVIVLNTHGLERRSALVTVDFNLSPVGANLRVLYNSEWPPSALRSLRRSETVVVQSVQGRAAVAVELAPAGMMILA
ncbi:MAG: alpha-amylase family glycosyl hydrolase [Aggregatilineales bacterium]